MKWKRSRGNRVPFLCPANKMMGLAGQGYLLDIVGDSRVLYRIMSSDLFDYVYWHMALP